jgi:hypothetical protein
MQAKRIVTPAAAVTSHPITAACHAAGLTTEARQGLVRLAVVLHDAILQNNLFETLVAMHGTDGLNLFLPNAGNIDLDALFREAPEQFAQVIMHLPMQEYVRYTRLPPSDSVVTTDDYNADVDGQWPALIAGIVYWASCLNAAEAANAEKELSVSRGSVSQLAQYVSQLALRIGYCKLGDFYFEHALYAYSQPLRRPDSLVRRARQLVAARTQMPLAERVAYCTNLLFRNPQLQNGAVRDAAGRAQSTTLEQLLQGRVMSPAYIDAIIALISQQRLAG